ncbi:NTP transferase domain-containing protein [Candidatus Wolfebacteria bacterium]|nr:NTP transferase domain-containing protein [Candidatus Magasanikbacteria bacterium]MBI5401611.1 NTP transferase domain-containing protein [Candidatus Wolfebacteria bacterium]
MKSRIPCVILAGGIGTRMSHFTKDIPKSMIPVNGIPFIGRQLELLARNDITDIILSIGYKSGAIRDYAGDGKKWNISVKYIDEGDELRGTGGAIRFIEENKILPAKFFLLYGDSYLDVDYKKIWKTFDKLGKPALLTVLKNSGNWDNSNTIFKNGALILYDKFAEDKSKMKYVDYGLAILTKKILQKYFFEKKIFDLADIYNLLSKKSLLAGYEVKNRFYEIGSSRGLKELGDKLKEKI